MGRSARRGAKPGANELSFDTVCPKNKRKLAPQTPMQGPSAASAVSALSLLGAVRRRRSPARLTKPPFEPMGLAPALTTLRALPCIPSLSTA